MNLSARESHQLIQVQSWTVRRRHAVHHAQGQQLNTKGIRMRSCSSTLISIVYWWIQTEAIAIGTSVWSKKRLVHTVDLGSVSVTQRVVFEVWESLSMAWCRSVNMWITSASRLTSTSRRCATFGDAAKTSACSMVNGWLDYCNSLLHRTSSSNINKLQRVQNSVARIITRRRLSDHITPVLADLHWLPVQYRIQYKLAAIKFKVLTTQKLRYLHELVQSHANCDQMVEIYCKSTE